MVDMFQNAAIGFLFVIAFYELRWHRTVQSILTAQLELIDRIANILCGDKKE